MKLQTIAPNGRVSALAPLKTGLAADAASAITCSHGARLVLDAARGNIARRLARCVWTLEPVGVTVIPMDMGTGKTIGVLFPHGMDARIVAGVCAWLDWMNAMGGTINMVMARNGHAMSTAQIAELYNVRTRKGTLSTDERLVRQTAMAADPAWVLIEKQDPARLVARCHACESCSASVGLLMGEQAPCDVTGGTARSLNDALTSIKSWTHGSMTGVRAMGLAEWTQAQEAMALVAGARLAANGFVCGSGGYDYLLG